MKKLLFLTLFTSLFIGCADDEQDENLFNFKTAGTITVPNQYGSSVEISNTVIHEEVWPIPVDFIYALTKPMEEIVNSVIFAFSVVDPNTTPCIKYYESSSYYGSVFHVDDFLQYKSLQTPYTGTTLIALVDRNKANKVIAKIKELQNILIYVQPPSMVDYAALVNICYEIIELTKNDTYIYKLYVEN